MTEALTPSPDGPSSHSSPLPYIVSALLCGPVVSFGGFVLLIHQFNWSGGNSDTLRGAGMLGFLGGGLAFVGGLCWGVFFAIDRLRKRHREWRNSSGP
jgi:hypothetical protein